jgi:hypothetical protein
MALVLLALRFVELGPKGNARVELFTEGLIAGVVGIAGVWWLALSADERVSIGGKLLRKLGRKGGA